MDIGVCNMTTLIDDGLEESCLNDPVPVIDLDQINVVDVDNIDAVIEDPGYILDEVPKTLNRNEEYSSSYKKRSFTLPVAFFDISRNIRLLKKCRPIIIKIVDCDIYPWYYKRNKHIKNESDIPNRDENTKLFNLSYGINDMTSSTCYNTGVRDTVCTTPAPAIDLSSEQRAVVLKLKEEIDNQVYQNKIGKIVDDLDKTKLINHENTSVTKNNKPECRFDKSIETQDLLTYKEIAQTIVRKIESDKKTDNSNFIHNPSTNDNRENIEKIDRNETERKKSYRGNISTSPILPYSVRRQKKIKPKEKILEKSPIVNNILEKCCDSSKKCDKFLSTVDQLIPHYHCKRPQSVNNNNSNFYFTSMVANHTNFQQSMTNDLLLHRYQPINKISDCNSIPIDTCQERLVSFTSNIGEMSYDGFGTEMWDNSLVNRSYVTRDQFTENINPNRHMYICDYHLHYPSLIHYQNAFNAASQYPSQTKVNNVNNLRLVRRPSAMQVSKESFREYSPSSKDLYKNCIPNSMYLLNDNVNYSTAQIPLQRTVGNVMQRNPLLTQLLNWNNQSEYYQPMMQQCGGLGTRPVVGCTPSSMEQDIWWPLRPPPPPPPLPPPPPPPSVPSQYNLTSPQFAQGKNVHCPSTGLLQPFSNNRNDLPHHKANSNMEHSDINLREANKDFNNLKNIPIDSPTITMTPKIDSKKHNNMIVHTEKQNIKQVAPGSCGFADPKLLYNLNTKVNDNNIVNVSTEPPKNIDVKISGKESKIIGYSPPILPIPSFKRSLEMLSELQHAPVNSGINSNLKTNTSIKIDMNEQRKANEESRDIVRKRKLSDEEKIYISSKRISLNEYKQRRSDNMIAII